MEYPFTAVSSPTAKHAAELHDPVDSLAGEFPSYQSMQSTNVFDNNNATCIPQTLVYTPKSTPFERHTYEVLLATLQEVIVKEYNSISERLNLVLEITGLKYFISGDTEYPPTQIFPPKIQKEMAGLRFQMESLQRKIMDFKRCILEDVLSEEISMAFMNLSFLSENASYYM